MSKIKQLDRGRLDPYAPIQKAPLFAPDAMRSRGYSVRLADGREEPLIWLRGFSPAFAMTYWLRRPIEVSAGSRVAITADSGQSACRVRFIYGQP